MRGIHDKQYTQFTPKERMQLTFSALSRGDTTEATRLWETCPKHTYICRDINYMLRVDALMIIGSLFFQECVRHYNCIERADRYICDSIVELDYEEEYGLKDIAEKSQQIIDRVSKARDKRIAALKGLYEGFNQFCMEKEVNSEHVLKLIPIEDCCFNIAYLLASDIAVEMEYAMYIKKLFLEHWHF